ncbi:MAG: glycosyltransferase family 2 protein [Ignavibacteriales bacterium]|nr:glycosyltransferase family 2 protein [Ignavibacteriales bacterium]
MKSTSVKLSVIVITHNEEKNIIGCLRSVAWADEIIVVDAKSTDETVENAAQFTTKIFITEWKGFAAAKNFALQKVSNEWILWLDADERVTPKLALEIKQLLSEASDEYVGYEIARRAYFLGKWIKHCGWYPGYVTRLFKCSAVKFKEMRVHEKLEVSGNVGKLNSDILHFTDDTLFHYLVKFNRYTTLAAEDLADGGKRSSYFDLLVRPPYLFFKMFFLHRGFLDGMHGFVLSLLSANYVFVKYAKLREMNRRLPKSSH